MARAIRFVSAQPDELHFIWQTQVYLHNFLSLGIPPERCVALFGVPPGQSPSPELTHLIAQFADADIRVYSDTRDARGRGYPPSIQPHLIDKALQDTPELEIEPTFYQDSDIAFRRLPDFERMLQEYPDTCLLSDTVDYIGYEHLHDVCEKLREERADLPQDDLIHRMCEIVGLDIDVVRRNDAHSGGAQYLLQGVGRAYWQKVYNDSLAIRDLFNRYFDEHQFSKTAEDYIQVWTAGMWAYLWNLWWFGRQTVVHPEMRFLFSGHDSHENATILHMAGLPDELWHSHFTKEDWWALNPVTTLARQPCLLDHFPEHTVAREYAELIRRAAGMKRRRLQPATPAQYWRLLVWKTQNRSDIWDVERVEMEFGADISISDYFDSGNAGENYRVANAFSDGDGYWGGRPQAGPGQYPCLYLGVRLNRPALPDIIRLTQSAGPHCAHTALVQWSSDGDHWQTAEIARLEPALYRQPVFYRRRVGRTAGGWRLVAREPAGGFAWDVRRLAFLGYDGSLSGTAISSGFAGTGEESEDYSHANAFLDNSRFWGGRPDANGVFTIGLESTQELAVNRVLLEQSDMHWMACVEVQLRDASDGWIPFRQVENLAPGVNHILLLETAN